MSVRLSEHLTMGAQLLSWLDASWQSEQSHTDRLADWARLIVYTSAQTASFLSYSPDPRNCSVGLDYMAMNIVLSIIAKHWPGWL